MRPMCPSRAAPVLLFGANSAAMFPAAAATMHAAIPFLQLKVFTHAGQQPVCTVWLRHVAQASQAQRQQD
eukprot:scaffold142826_cov22-Tisochrysis_lutea.AAC.1